MRGPARNRVTTTSSNEVMNANTAPASTLPLISGKVTVRKAVTRPAPRLRAASSIDRSNACSPDDTIRTTNGSTRTMCAASRLTKEPPRPTRL